VEGRATSKSFELVVSKFAATELFVRRQENCDASVGESDLLKETFGGAGLAN
jgi:hypothetical protein